MEARISKFSLYSMLLLVISAAMLFGLNEIFGPRNQVARGNQAISVAVANRTFNIEKHYLQTLPLPGENSFLVKLYWPEMISEADARQKNRSLITQVGTILIEAQDIRPSLGEQMDYLRDGVLEETNLGPMYTLEHSRFSSKGGSEGRSVSDVFVFSKDNVIKTKIVCAVTNLPYPTCLHSFVDKGLLYAISYNRENFLQQWRQMEKRSISLIDGFEVNRR